MPAALDLPARLDHLPYFVVLFHRDLGNFELVEPGRASTYALGDVFATRRYLERVAGEYLGGRALDSAYAFGASMTVMSERRAFGLDLTKIDLNAGILRMERVRDIERLLGEEWLDDDREFIA